MLNKFKYFQYSYFTANNNGIPFPILKTDIVYGSQNLGVISSLARQKWQEGVEMWNENLKIAHGNGGNVFDELEVEKKIGVGWMKETTQ